MEQQNAMEWENDQFVGEFLGGGFEPDPSTQELGVELENFCELDQLSAADNDLVSYLSGKTFPNNYTPAYCFTSDKRASEFESESSQSNGPVGADVESQQLQEYVNAYLQSRVDEEILDREDCGVEDGRSFDFGLSADEDFNILPSSRRDPFPSESAGGDFYASVAADDGNSLVCSLSHCSSTVNTEKKTTVKSKEPIGTTKDSTVSCSHHSQLQAQQVPMVSSQSIKSVTTGQIPTSEKATAARSVVAKVAKQCSKKKTAKHVTKLTSAVQDSTILATEESVSPDKRGLLLQAQAHKLSMVTLQRAATAQNLTKVLIAKETVRTELSAVTSEGHDTQLQCQNISHVSSQCLDEISVSTKLSILASAAREITVATEGSTISAGGLTVAALGLTVPTEESTVEAEQSAVATKSTVTARECTVTAKESTVTSGTVTSGERDSRPQSQKVLQLLRQMIRNRSKADTAKPPDERTDEPERPVNEDIFTEPSRKNKTGVSTSKSAVAARLQRQKYKEYMANLEDTAEKLFIENVLLKKQDAVKTRQIEQLEEEVRYLKQVMANNHVLSIQKNTSAVNELNQASSPLPTTAEQDEKCQNKSSTSTVVVEKCETLRRPFDWDGIECDIPAKSKRSHCL